MNKILIISTIGLLFLSCGGQKMFRSPTPGFGFTSKTYNVDETSFEYQMQLALLTTDADECYREVEKLLKKGADPNKKAGQFKWIDTNPLWNCCLNKNLVSLFVSYGADVKKRPYIAKAISGRIAVSQEQYDEWKKEGYACIGLEESLIESVTILLNNGADPNLKWIGGEKVLIPATDWNYLHYFKKHGKPPINNAIKYNAMKLAILLLENGAILDEDSLKLAKEMTERTGSNEMEELVKKHWNLQNEK
ncbi:MAG: hypothetical protein J5965_28050 [Aeriscardovia sp.]|nr:hypothetical protein [Aeriscardovia sp.]